MNISSIQFLLTLGVMSIIVIFMLAVGWFFVRVKPADSHRFSWHQLVKDSFHISVIDRSGREHTVDIHYNVTEGAPGYKILSDRRLQIHLPIGFTRTEFFEFVSTIMDVDGYHFAIINGIRQEKLLSNFHFSHDDISIYRDFKRHLLLKALKV